MRTQDPANIRTDFDDSINDIETAYNSADAGVQDDGPKNLIAEHLFVAAATLFEGYVSDIFVAYINRNSERFRTHLLEKMVIEATDEIAKRSIQHVEKLMPHLSVDKIREILDPTGFNVTFPTTDKMKESAGKWLVDADRQKFTTASSQQCAAIDFIKAVRNYLAHRSQSADNRMQEALAAIDLPAELRRLNNNVNNVGSWLRATPPQGIQPRFRYALAQFRNLAVQLCP